MLVPHTTKWKANQARDLLPFGSCITHVSWDVTGYQGLFCPSNKPFCDRWLGCVQGVKSSGRGVFIGWNGHYYEKSRGEFLFLFTVFKVITLFYLALVYPTLFDLAFLSFTLFHLGRLVPLFIVYDPISYRLMPCKQIQFVHFRCN